MLRVTREGDMTKSVFPGFKKAVEGLEFEVEVTGGEVSREHTNDCDYRCMHR